MTIVVCSCGATDGLEQLLDSIDQAIRSSFTTGIATHIDVLVVRDGPVEGVEKYLVEREREFPTAVEVREISPRGIAATRNHGISTATGEVVWLLDERTVVTSDALDRHRSHDRAAGQILIGPCALPSADPEAFDADWWYDLRDRRLAESRFIRDPRDCVFGNASGPTEVLRSFPFDDGFRRVEMADLEVGVRMLDAGVVIEFDASAAVRTVTGASSDDRWRVMHQQGADRVRFLARHPDQPEVVFHTGPGATERGLRRFVGRRRSGLLGLVLRPTARGLAWTATSPPGRRGAPTLTRFAELCALYAGVVEASDTTADARRLVRSSMATSLTAASIPRSRIARWWQENIADRVRAAILPLRIHHVHGPRAIERDPDDLLAITTVRNGEFYLPSFFDHHRRLGIAHFLFLDNGSTDGTIEFLRAQDDVSVFRTSVPYRTHENLMKRYMVRKHSHRKWNVFLDVDELFDYPQSDRLDVRGLLGYLAHHGYTAVVVQMLDMFSAEPLARTPSEPSDLGSIFPYFDITDISKRPYEFDLRPDSTLQSHHGGIRRSVFGSENLLTKAALIFVDDEIETFVAWHHVRKARIADISCVLLHYPFNRAFYEKAEEAVRSGRYGLGASHEYRAYWSVLADDLDLSLHRASAQRYVGVDQLVDLGFVHVSAAYREWVTDHLSTARIGPSGSQ
ncbi:MAG: glycosyltransferase family 2 protein [Acidimicrobiales bacterium]